ncbi:neurotensin receptor type 2 isoform X5 [Macaca fascicularis]|uniref:neurotensin receptor type 2 isoform X5 n=1 Tax=Macaca fascicularis TaxID=9541 RepID=UPI0032B029D3
METSSPPPPRSSPNLGLSLDARLGVDTRLWAKVLFTALYALIWALGAAGNALSVHVVLKARAGRAGRLRYHVLSLALSGLLLLVVGVPVELYSFVWFHYPWVFGDLGCRGYYFVRELCAYATVLSVTGLSAERCLAVCQPLRARSLLTPRRTQRLVALLWAASLGLALPMALIMGQKHELETAGGEPEPASRVCTVLVSRTALQVFIQPEVCVPTSPPDGSGEDLPEGAIVAMYVICWLPYHARRLMYCYVPDDAWTDPLYNFYHYFYMVTNTLFYVSSALTPLLYNVMSSSFRKLFLEALSSLCGEHHPHGAVTP